MMLPLDIATSLEFWRRIYSLHRAPTGARKLPQDDVALSSNDIEHLTPSWATVHFLEKCGGALHTIGFQKTDRRKGKAREIHVYSRLPELPCFYLLDKHVYIASPELIFLVAASLLELPQLVALGDELCGTYSFDPDSKRGFRTRDVPLIAKEQLQKFLGNCANFPNIARARKALGFVVDNSASPMETALELLLTLPFRMGGYGLPQPIMNFEVPLSMRAQQIVKQEKCRADLCYIKQRIDIEYDGVLDHSSSDDMQSDHARMNALMEEGYEVIVVTKRQFDDVFAFEAIVLMVARKLKKRIRREYLGNLPQRRSLRKSLAEWNASFGRIR